MRFELDSELTSGLKEQIVTLWVDVTNAGGAVGFVAPVDRETVWGMADPTFASIEEGHDRLLLGFDDAGQLVAMLIFVSRRFNLSEHWRTIKRVMVHPSGQGKGYGAQLMREGERLGRQMGLDGLYVTVRSGHGLERFYAGLGYKDVGRLPGTLRVGPGDDRDEILMWLAL